MSEVKDIIAFSQDQLRERLLYLDSKNAYELSWLELLLLRVYELGKREPINENTPRH